MSFEEIVQRTYCPFARPSKMGPGITFRTPHVEEDVAQHREIIAEFFRTARENSFDGMVITFAAPSVGASLATLAETTRRFYRTLAELFPTVYIPDDPRPDERWYAMIERELFFLVSFAPCYPPVSPRHTYGDQRTYFLLQPASTFERQARSIERRRTAINRAFAVAGKPYDAGLANVDNDMFKAVMPIDPIDRHIPWWETDEAGRRESRAR